MESVSDQSDLVRRLTKTDPDPRVRHRADAVLLMAGGMPLIRTARCRETSPSRIRAWRTRFLAQGRAGVADQPRTGRPPKLAAQVCAVSGEAIEAGPAASGVPVTVWSVRHLRERLAPVWRPRLCRHGASGSAPAGLALSSSPA